MKYFEDIVDKRENAGNHHFLLFPRRFLPIQKGMSVFKLHLFCRLQMLSIWTSLKICHLIQSQVIGFVSQWLETIVRKRENVEVGVG